MKTAKMLMSASVLAMTFAACSNEFDVQNQPSSNLGNRPSAGKVVITPNLVGSADTRAEWVDGGWEWSANDRFGAMLMDDWNQTNEGNTTIADYTFTDYIHTNYPFSTTDGVTWSTPEDAALCEGNYFFVYPYNNKYKMRGHVGFGLKNNQVQEIDNPTSVVRDNQKYLGYAFIEATEADVNNVDVAFHPLFANPKFKLQNVSGMPLRLIKLVIRTHQPSLAGSPLLMADSVVLAPMSKNFAESAAKYPEMTLGAKGEQTEYLFSHATLVQNGFYAQTPAADSKITTTKEEGVYEYTVSFDKDYIVPAGEFFRVSVVMPAGEYGDFDVFAFIEEQNSEKTTGVVKFEDTNKSHWTGFDTQNGAQQTLLAPGKTQVFSASFDSEAIKNLGLKDFTVVSSEDLAWIIDLKAKNGGKDLVTIKTLGDKVEMTKEVYDLISACNRKNIRWQIDGTIVIPADAAADAIDQLTTGATAYTIIINKGAQVLSKDVTDCDIINYGELNTKSVDVEANITNAGVVVAGNVKGNVNNLKDGKFTVNTVEGTVVNAGELYIQEKVDGTVTNDGIAEIANAVKAVVNNETMTLNGALYEATVINNGEMTIAKDSKFSYESNSMNANAQALNNHGTLNINANAEVTGQNKIRFYNDGTVVIADGKVVDFTYIKNYDGGEITVGDDAVMISAKNKAGEIVNEEDCVINNAGTIHNVMNNGTIKVVDASSITNVTGGNGVIDNTVMGDVTYNEEQTCVYCVKETSATFEDLAKNVTSAKANRLEVADSELSWTNGNKIGEVTFGKGVELNNVTLNAAEGSSRLLINADGMSVKGTTEIKRGEVAVQKDASNGTKLEVTGTLNISNTAILRGGANAKLTIEFTKGEVHNNGTVKFISNVNDCQVKDGNHWTGNAATDK